MSLYEPLFRALNEAGVRYVVVGGLAVVLHGHARLTVDVDLAIDLAPGEATRAISAIVGLGMKPRVPVDPMDFAKEATRLEWFRERHMRVFTMVDPANPMRAVDLFVENPVPFDVLWRNSIAMALWDIEVHVASIPDLIQMKRRAGRRRISVTSNTSRPSPGGRPASMSDADVADKAAWDQSQADARRDHLRASLAATPEQRLTWLEGALEIAHRSGALANARAASEESAAGGEGVDNPRSS